MAAMTKSFRKKLKAIAEQYGAEVIFKSMDLGGFFSRPKTIAINKNIPNDEAIQVLFHELGHLHAYKNRLFSCYHRPKKTRKAMVAFFRTALRAERWVDNWGKREFKKVTRSNARWEPAYASKSEIEYLERYCNSYWEGVFKT